MKSLNGTRASLRAVHTSEDEHVMHSTNVGYKDITCAQVLPSTETNEINCIRKTKYLIHKVNTTKLSCQLLVHTLDTAGPTTECGVGVRNIF